jgi:SAM-dependent methyltransferase
VGFLLTLDTLEDLMSVKVLAKAADNTCARSEMRRRGLDFVTPWFAKILHKARIVSGIDVGDLRKSWDVLRTLNFIEERVSKTASVLDLGAYASEVLCGLRQLGFSDLAGIDLNPALTRMPYNQDIRYVTGDFTHTSLPSNAFAAITAISVLEHGFRSADVFREVSRILQTGGYFIASVDYWPEKIDTRGVVFFGLDWTIFSKSELLELIAEAGRYDLVPVGELHFEAPEPTVRCLEREYTFAWFALQKLEGRCEQE